MMISDYNEDSIKEDLAWLIKLHVDGLLVDMDDPQETLELLKDLIEFERQLAKFDEPKRS